MPCPCGHNDLGYEITPTRTLLARRLKPDAPGWWAVHRAVALAHQEDLQEVELIDLSAGIRYQVNWALFRLWAQPSADAFWLPLTHWRQSAADVKQLALEAP